MAEGCGGGFAKMMLIVLNSIFWLTGAALIGVGIWMVVDPKALLDITHVTYLTDNDLIKYSAYLFLAVGAFVFIVAFIGCFGAVKENRCFLFIYIVLLFVVMAAELAAGVLAFVYKDKIRKEVTEVVHKKMKTADYPTDQFWKILDLVQSQFRCCGLDTYEDYKDIDFKMEYPYPYSCCSLKTQYEPSDNITSTMVNCGDGPFKKGCKDQILEMVSSKLLVLIGIGIGLAVFQILMAVFAICLCRRTEK